MTDYTRPAIEPQEYRDEFGAVIRYGTRWSGSPPDDSYSRASNPDRFAPLQTIAEALIQHLRTAYRAHASSTTNLVSVTPEHPDGAPLVFRFTDFPGVVIRAGVRYSAAFPACGCDACDETWQQAADDMERLVFAVTDGGFSERITGPSRYEYRVETVGGGVQWGATAVVEPDPALPDDAARLESLPAGHWRPWTRSLGV